MTVLENPEVLKQHGNVVTNLGIRIPIWRTEYIINPGKGYDSERKTALIGAENAESVMRIIKNFVTKGVPFQWESNPSLIVPEIHGFTPSLERDLFLYLKKKYEGPSKVDKAKKLMKRGG